MHSPIKMLFYAFYIEFLGAYLLKTVLIIFTRTDVHILKLSFSHKIPTKRKKQSKHTAVT